MEAVDIRGLLAQLREEHCELNHGPGTRFEKRVAVDYIIQPLSYIPNDTEEIAVREMIVPVCTDCIETMQGNDWTLFYCTECCSSLWVHKKFAPHNSHHNILWMRGCAECSFEFGGLYSNEIMAIKGNPLFVSRMEVPAAA